jgi:hypothetical protein
LAFVYQIFGLTVHSEIPLPTCERRGGAVDIEIRIAGESLEPAGPVVFESGQGNVAADESSIWVDLPHSCRSSISRNGKIAVEPTSVEACGNAILDTILPIDLLRRGSHVLLHSSAVEIDGSAVGFLGPSGSGKSTTCLSLHLRGHSVLADDVLVIRTQLSPAQATVLPGNSTFRLNSDSARLATPDLSQLASIERQNGTKLQLPTPSGEVDPLPLSALVVVSRGETPRLVRLPADQALLQIIRNNAGLGLTHALGLAASNFKMCSGLAASIPVFELTRSDSFSDLDAQTDKIEKLVRKLAKNEAGSAEV